MIDAAKTFLTARIKEILLPDGETPAYTDDDVFFGNMTRDYLKDHKYAANCLIFQDRKKKDGSLIAKERNQECTYYTFTRRRFHRTVLFRCLLYAATFTDLWGETGVTGFIDQFEQKIAEADRVIPDSENRAVRINLYDAVRPWNAEEATRQVKKRPLLAISRVEFTGGIYTTYSVPIIPSIEITPDHN